jgi:hypothetical protein
MFSAQSGLRSGWCSHSGHVSGSVSWPAHSVSVRRADGMHWRGTFGANGFFTTGQAAGRGGEAGADAALEPRGNRAQGRRTATLENGWGGQEGVRKRIWIRQRRHGGRGRGCRVRRKISVGRMQIFSRHPISYLGVHLSKHRGFK